MKKFFIVLIFFISITITGCSLSMNTTDPKLKQAINSENRKSEELENEQNSKENNVEKQNVVQNTNDVENENIELDYKKVAKAFYKMSTPELDARARELEDLEKVRWRYATHGEYTIEEHNNGKCNFPEEEKKYLESGGIKHNQYCNPVSELYDDYSNSYVPVTEYYDKRILDIKKTLRMDYLGNYGLTEKDVEEIMYRVIDFDKPQNMKVVNTKDFLALRDRPTTKNSHIYDKIAKDSVVSAYGISMGWYLIFLEPNHSGFCNGDYLEFTEESENVKRYDQ